MYRVALSLFLTAVLLTNCRAAEESLADLKARLASANPDDRAELCIRIAQRQVHEADRLYNEGHVDDARAAVEDVVAFSEQARDAGIQSKKHLKSLEIDTRKMSEKLRDIKRTLAFDDQPPVDQAVRRLEAVRSSLLSEMFSDKKGKK